MEHTDEVVDVVGPVAARIQSLGQREERLRVIGEVVNVEDSFWVRDVVLLQVSVKACSRSSEKGQFDTDIIIMVMIIMVMPSFRGILQP